MNTQVLPRNPVPAILGLSAVVAAFLFWLIYFKTPAASDAGWVGLLPTVNAVCNSLSAICLILGFLQIKRGNREVHKRFMLAAVGFSAIFLISYITYHNFHGDTKFPGQGWIRPAYFSILISHIVLSVVALPMVFSTLFFAASGRFASHKKIARWTFPVWLYVSVTGVLVFLILRAYTG